MQRFIDDTVALVMILLVWLHDWRSEGILSMTPSRRTFIEHLTCQSQSLSEGEGEGPEDETRGRE
jgi:hypothetical protein